jgi:elongation factor Ts
MADITAKDVKILRDRTGAGMMDCKRALQETDGDMEAAIDLLRSRGAAKAAKRAEKSANEGTIGSYIHFSNKIGVLVEVNCETDFVANTDDFKQLAKDLAMHIASAKPLAVRAEDIPPETVERERHVYLEQVRNEGKPEHIHDKIVEGKMRKFYEENVLFQQPFVKDPEKTVGELVTEVSAKTGERIEVSQFARFGIGES